MRAEPGRFADVAAKSVGAVWRAYDLQLSVYAALLAAFGLVMAYTNSVESGESLLTGTVFQRALMWSAIAMVVYVVMTAFDYRWLKTVAWPVYFVNLGLLVLTLAIGDGVGGSARWVGVGPVQFQFSELAKILMIIVLATYLGNREGRLDSFASIVGACLLMGPAVALVMLFLSGASLARLLVIGFGMLAVIPVAWLYLLRDYQKDRILSFLNPSTDVLGSGWQVAQAQMTVGSGGVVGTGLTNGGLVRGGYLPVQESDFVFPVLAQELGFIGAVVVFLLFIALLWRILACAWRSRDPFGTMFGAGLASAILIQVFVNVGMGIGILPVTGIPLPFISHGGASLISLAIGLGVIQSINIRQHRAEW